MNIVDHARSQAREYHAGQVRDDGKDYFEAHLQQVVHILEQLTDDEDILAAGWLHDTIEDTEMTYEHLHDFFGKRIADLVMEVTQEGKKDSYGFYFPRLHSKEGIMIKMADRLSNISQMDGWDEKRQAHYLRKTKFWKDGKDR